MKRWKRGNVMVWTGAICLSVIMIAVIFFRMPYSPVKSAFYAAVQPGIDAVSDTQDVFAEDDIGALPPPVQDYFRFCGYLGKPKMSYIKLSLKNVDFALSADKWIQMDYTQVNFADRPERFAFISSFLYGIPFQGLDSFENGAGRMKGTLAKLIPLFDQRGVSMDKACLATFLAECLMLPSAALKEYIEWSPIDATHAGAVISYGGISAEGIFTFDQNGALLSFETDDRTAVDMQGNERKAKWSAFFDDYQEDGGVKRPRVIQSVWHYPEGELVYFNRNRSAVVISY